MLKNETLQLKAVTASLEEGKFIIRFKIFNPEKRTLHAYGSPRRILYDNASGKLTIYLHDHTLNAEEEKILSPHLKQPCFVPLEAGIESEIKISLDPVIKRIRPSAERGNGPIFEELRISEAKDIEVEIAYQDTPFYYNPKIGNAKQLKEWGKTISKAHFKITPLKAEHGKSKGK